MPVRDPPPCAAGLSYFSLPRSSSASSTVPTLLHHTIQASPASLAVPTCHLSHPNQMASSAPDKPCVNLCAMPPRSLKWSLCPFSPHTSDTDSKSWGFSPSLPSFPPSEPGSAHLLFSSRMPDTIVFLTPPLPC